MTIRPKAELHDFATPRPVGVGLRARLDAAPFRVRVAVAMIVCLFPAILVVGLSSYTLSTILHTSQREALTDDLSKGAAMAAKSALQCRRYEKDMLLTCRNTAAQDEYAAKWSAAVEATKSLLDELAAQTAPGALMADAQSHGTLARLADDLTAYEAAVKRVVAQGRATGEQDPVVLNDALSADKASISAVITACESMNSSFGEQAAPIEEAVHTNLGRLATGLAAGTVVTLALGFASVVVVPRLLTRRLVGLGQFADAVGKGDLDVRSAVSGGDEVGRLSRALNRMLDDLGTSMEREQAAAIGEAEARHASEIKMRFLANMSHEIRTPMTAILGFTDLLLEPALTVQNRMAYTETIRRNGNHLLGLINDVLDLSKIQAEKMTINVGSAQVCRLVAEAAAMVRVRAAEKGLPLNVIYEFPIPEFIQTDGLRLRQVLVNLLGNAVKFTEHGSVRLVVRADGLRTVKPYITFVIADTGVGMTQEQLANLFQPFAQVDDSATRRFGGTGLGLCISKELTDRMGGSLSVASNPGEGTTFTLQMPVGDISSVRLVQNAEEALAEAAPDTRGIASVRLRGRVLLAEDGPDNQRLIKLVLTKAGAEVDVAENGRLALEAALAAEAAGRPYGLVLMDMQMPVLDGYSATSELRERGYTRPIVALTAHAMPLDRQRCLIAGCNEYATKPIDRATFLPLVDRFLSTGGSPQAA